MLLQITFDHLESMNRQIETDKPKAAFANHVSGSDYLIDMNTMAKLAKKSKIQIGRTRLFEWLRDHGILMKNNVPYCDCSKMRGDVTKQKPRTAAFVYAVGIMSVSAALA